MSTDKQILANQANALLSTGPITAEGKAIIASNAIKHGIFTKDLIVSSSMGQENEAEYEEVLSNLISCLAPRNQMENLLVEKIAIDFWRLRRTIRFETGSISKNINVILKSHYSYGNRDNSELDEEIQYTTERIDWNSAYVECLQKNEVTFDRPTWSGKDIESDINEDFYLIARSLPNLSSDEQNRLYEGKFTFIELVTFLKKHGHSKTEKISAKLVEIYSDQNQHLEEKIEELERKKSSNLSADKLNCTLGMIPPEDSADKILKYERSIQKSIFQNLVLLKKLQGSF